MFKTILENRKCRYLSILVQETYNKIERKAHWAWLKINMFILRNQNLPNDLTIKKVEAHVYSKLNKSYFIWPFLIVCIIVHEAKSRWKYITEDNQKT